MADRLLEDFAFGLAGVVLALSHDNMLRETDPLRRDAYILDVCTITDRYGLPHGWWEDPSRLSWRSWRRGAEVSRG